MSFPARPFLVVGFAVALRWCITLDQVALAQLGVVAYNTATAAPARGAVTARIGAATVLEAIGAEHVGGLAKPIDVLLLQEQFSMATSAQSFVDLLNDLYDPIHRTMYARSEVNGRASTDFIPAPGTGAGGRLGLVCNTQTVDLIGELAFGRAVAQRSGIGRCDESGGCQRAHQHPRAFCGRPCEPASFFKHATTSTCRSAFIASNSHRRQELFPTPKMVLRVTKWG